MSGPRQAAPLPPVMPENDGPAGLYGEGVLSPDQMQVAGAYWSAWWDRRNAEADKSGTPSKGHRGQVRFLGVGRRAGGAQ